MTNLGRIQERITVNLSPAAGTALRNVTARTGDNLTAAVARALTLYDRLTAAIEAGGVVTIQVRAGAPQERIMIL